MSVKVTRGLADIHADVMQLQLQELATTPEFQVEIALYTASHFFDITEYGDSKLQKSRNCIVLVNFVVM